MECQFLVREVKKAKAKKIWRHLYLRAAAPADQARQAPTAHQAYAIVRPTLLSEPETLGNGTETAYNVGVDMACLMINNDI